MTAELRRQTRAATDTDVKESLTSSMPVVLARTSRAQHAISNADPHQSYTAEPPAWVITSPTCLMVTENYLTTCSQSRNGLHPTPVARHPDVHLAIRPGTNVMLLNALLHELIANDHIDHDWVQAHTVGFDALAKIVAEYPPERAAEVCGVRAEDIRTAAALLGRAGRASPTLNAESPRLSSRLDEREGRRARAALSVPSHR
jgi:Molybdopterin oxidoreductase